MSRSPPDEWPTRPEGFYSDWTVFCTEVFRDFLRQQRADDWVAVVLLAGGAALGAAGLFALIEANSEIIDEKGEEWGIENLSSYTQGSGVLVGAAIGGAGALLLMRILGAHADREAVDKLSRELRNARREYEELRQDKQADLMTHAQYKAAIEHLYWRLQQE